MDERLQKILSQWGVASRRHAEQLIVEGRVRLNGAIATLGQKADPEFDQIEVDGRLIQPTNRPRSIYLLMNKPIGVVSTCSDPWNRETVLDLLPSHLQKTQGLHPVGRLDAASTGALLLTNDGTITFALTHPSHSVPKTYHVWVKGHPHEAVLRQWRQGVLLDSKLTLPAEVEVLDTTTADQTKLKIILREGRNRQIRRVAEQLGYPVVRLHRIAIGSIQLGQLSSGQYRTLNQVEVNFLKETAEHISQLMPDRQ
ncbi:rRNA pseudouridine synthase [Oscillatoria sp. FACHB-1407]|uniref:pseudouridine synthase n=1 Tax=Oscillatoria sp. FACHB-1407 TaxID=2692847 RepID=UPI001684E618|nr:pseudouridine synthase [Oscillatoria sp. FACHB-1407]MBD2465827.1 rRNA pseudouridine synthase [Oscillatoria sp. FACHB-1407]